jgi:hypothetical protein
MMRKAAFGVCERECVHVNNERERERECVIYVHVCNGIEFGRSRTGEGSSGGRKRGVV